MKDPVPGTGNGNLTALTSLPMAVFPLPSPKEPTSGLVSESEGDLIGTHTRKIKIR